jgi:hypothetical protein
VTGPEGAFRRSGVKTTLAAGLELVRFAAQPSKGALAATGTRAASEAIAAHGEQRGRVPR